MKNSEATLENAITISRAVELMHEATLELDKIIIGPLTDNMVRELRRLRKAVYSLAGEIERGPGLALSDDDVLGTTLGGEPLAEREED